MREDVDLELSEFVFWVRTQRKRDAKSTVPDLGSKARVIEAAWRAKRPVYRRKFRIRGEFPTAELLPVGRRRKKVAGEHTYVRCTVSGIAKDVADEMRGLVRLNSRLDSPHSEFSDLGGVAGDILVAFLVDAAQRYNGGASFSGHPLPH